MTAIVTPIVMYGDHKIPWPILVAALLFAVLLGAIGWAVSAWDNHMRTADGRWRKKASRRWRERP